jgi:hypothetical protein
VKLTNIKAHLVAIGYKQEYNVDYKEFLLWLQGMIQLDWLLLWQLRFMANLVKLTILYKNPR